MLLHVTGLFALGNNFSFCVVSATLKGERTKLVQLANGLQVMLSFAQFAQSGEYQHTMYSWVDGEQPQISATSLATFSRKNRALLWQHLRTWGALGTIVFVRTQTRCPVSSIRQQRIWKRFTPCRFLLSFATRWWAEKCGSTLPPLHALLRIERQGKLWLASFIWWISLVDTSTQIEKENGDISASSAQNVE